jgi:RNA polymerase sigma-70 factor (ECF subfamily)
MSASFAGLDPVREASLVESARGSAEARRAAFDAIFVHFRGPVLALCRHVTNHPGDAEDALQDCFLAVHGGLASFRGEARLATWIYRIALRSALAVRARRRPSQSLETEPAQEGHERHLLARDETRRVAMMMERLAPEQRVVLSLFAVEELSHREIADILGIPEGTVWSRLAAARRELARALRDEP